MGIVRKQATKNLIIHYIGMIVGYVNTVLLFPHILNPDQFGLTRVLLALGVLFAQFSQLGSNQILLRFFPGLKEDPKRMKGLVMMCLVIPLVGFLVISGISLIWKDALIGYYSSRSSMLAEHLGFLFPLVLFSLLITSLDAYLQSLFKTALVTFLNQFLIRVVWMVLIIMYKYAWLDFDTFLYLFVFAYALMLLIVLIYLLAISAFPISAHVKFPSKHEFRAMMAYGSFSFISGMSGLFMSQIDTILVGLMLGLREAGIYAVGIYIGNLISIPFQALNRISWPLFAEKWKLGLIRDIEDNYSKSSINLTIISGFLFSCIWLNIDFIESFLPAGFEASYWVILLTGLSKFSNSAWGTNGLILVSSARYRVDTFITVGAALTGLLLNLLFIPLWGTSGAAFAMLVSVFLCDLSRYIAIWKYFRIQPFGKGTALTLLFWVAMYFLITGIPWPAGFGIGNVILKVLILGACLLVFLFKSGVSSDLEEGIRKYIPGFK
ncbi:MAG: oligosaccharide flippase family protein [Flavobacteriales bacterium]|nr:oligosaccharide flippase family protein [Flavobacteriales bacterium]MCB9446983.1 oligosaccharide flippase family protein [Flavobacteriales bacterium]